MEYIAKFTLLTHVKLKIKINEELNCSKIMKVNTKKLHCYHWPKITTYIEQSLIQI